MIKGLFIMDKEFLDLVYPKEVKSEIEQLVDIYNAPMTKQEVLENKSILNGADVIFSGWGGPKLDQDFLDSAPNLKAMFYGAGSINKKVTDATWERGIKITTANQANAIPVAEYTLSQILFCLKGGWKFTHDIKKYKKYPKKPYYHVKGTFESTVGLISLSTVGKLVNELLQPFDIDVIAYDPFFSAAQMEELNVKKCSLDEVFECADVVSLHSPLIPETEGMIKGKHFDLLAENATFINTARGAIVNETEMIEVLKQRPDMTAVLDVAYPEPPAEGSPLYSLPNVALTPHIAGSEGEECGRLGVYMLEELKRYMNNEPLKWQVVNT